MSEPVIIQLVIAGQGVIVAALGLIGVVLTKVKRDAKAARTNSAAARVQVENDHSTNMREENDSRHAETKRWFDEMRADVAGRFATIGRDIGGLREEIRIDRSAANNRFESIEDRLKEKP